jgi:hypothetical protein
MGSGELTASPPAGTGHRHWEESAGAIARSGSVQRAGGNGSSRHDESDREAHGQRNKRNNVLVFQFGAVPATETAVTTKVTAKPMASSTSETTTLFFTGVSVHRGVGDRSGRYHESYPQAHRQQKERNNILVFHGAACLCFCTQELLYTSPQPILDQTADFVNDYGVFLEPVAMRGVR